MQRTTLHFCLASPLPQHTTHTYTHQPSFQNKASILRINYKPTPFTNSALASWTLNIPMILKHPSSSGFCSSQILPFELCSSQLHDWFSPALGMLHSYLALSKGLLWPPPQNAHGNIFVNRTHRNHTTAKPAYWQHSITWNWAGIFPSEVPLPWIPPESLIGGDKQSKSWTISLCSYFPCRIFLAHSLLLSFSDSICLYPPVSPLLIPSYNPNLHLTPKRQFINPTVKKLYSSRIFSS